MPGGILGVEEETYFSSYLDSPRQVIGEKKRDVYDMCLNVRKCTRSPK